MDCVSLLLCACPLCRWVREEGRDEKRVDKSGVMQPSSSMPSTTTPSPSLACTRAFTACFRFHSLSRNETTTSSDFTFVRDDATQSERERERSCREEAESSSSEIKSNAGTGAASASEKRATAAVDGRRGCCTAAATAVAVILTLTDTHSPFSASLSQPVCSRSLALLGVVH